MQIKYKCLSLRFFNRVFFVLFLLVLFLPFQKVSAGTNDDLSGFAWTDTYGWFSFNCTNKNNCIADGGDSDYGVNINRLTYNLSGYAWSDNIGWMSFQSDDTPPNTSFSSKCANTCNSAGHCTACFDWKSGEIYGWAKILSLSGDGSWVSLNCKNDDSCATSDYAVVLNREANRLTGYAWGDSATSSGIGWVSFSCMNDGSCPDGDPLPCKLPCMLKGCGGATLSAQLPFQFAELVGYGVILNNNAPVVTALTAPNNNNQEVCLGSAKTGVLDWSIIDNDTNSYQTAFRVIVNTSNTTSTPLYDSGKTTSTITQLTLNTTLNYNTSYYWWVKVWDEFNYDSRLVQFNHGTNHNDVLTDNVAYNNSHSANPDLTFTTYRHEFPDTDFTMTPKTPVQDQLSTLVGDVHYYTDAQPATPQDCGTSTCSILWSLSPTTTNSYLSSSTEAITKMSVDRASTSQSVTLTVTDNDGYTCSSSTSWGVNILPSWKEINPAR